MRPFRFTRIDGDGLHRFVHAPHDGVVVERSNPRLLSAGWPESGPTPYTEYAVNGSFGEELAVYLAFAWRLTDGLKRYVIPAHYHEHAANSLGKPCVYVDWEYDVDAEISEPLERARGFVPARASVRIWPEPTAAQRAHYAHAGMFAVDEFRYLVQLLLATLGDASAEVTLFALASDDGVDRLTASLSGEERPELSELMQGGDRFVDITIGVDLGYSDSLIIASKEDIGDEVAELASLYERAVERYEGRVDRTTTIDAVLAELARLVAANE